jgi:hypothetical protein
MPWHFDRLKDVDSIPILWGAWSAVDQYRLNRNPARPRVLRPTDQYLLEAARKGALDGELFGRFCREYEVFRNPINVMQGREKRLAQIAGLLATEYGKAELVTSEALSMAWWSAVEAVRDCLKTEFGKPFYMRSMCMKCLWLYQPDHATMWDSYAVEGLRNLRAANLSTKIETQDQAAYFLQEFEALYREKDALIKRVLEAIANLPNGMCYPYGRRVLDKALWFKGAEPSKQKQLLKALTDDPVRDHWLRNQLGSILSTLLA